MTARRTIIHIFPEEKVKRHGILVEVQVEEKVIMFLMTVLIINNVMIQNEYEGYV